MGAATPPPSPRPDIPIRRIKHVRAERSVTLRNKVGPSWQPVRGISRHSSTGQATMTFWRADSPTSAYGASVPYRMTLTGLVERGHDGKQLNNQLATRPSQFLRVRRSRLAGPRIHRSVG